MSLLSEEDKLLTKIETPISKIVNDVFNSSVALKVGEHTEILHMLGRLHTDITLYKKANKLGRFKKKLK